jgi:hypothetical protein
LHDANTSVAHHVLYVQCCGCHILLRSHLCRHAPFSVDDVLFAAEMKTRNRMGSLFRAPRFLSSDVCAVILTSASERYERYAPCHAQ